MRFCIAALTVALGLLLAWPAFAYVPHTGDRAAPLNGRDIKTDSELRLEDLRGKWVLLDFWHANCGPCKRDLPVICTAARPYLDRGELELVLVSLDDDKSTRKMKEFLATLPFRPHVIYSGKHGVPLGPPELVDLYQERYAPQAIDWGISGVPATFLITPEGVIAAKHLNGQNVADMLAYFIGRGEPYAPVALRTSTSYDADSQVTLFIEASSASHTPLQVRITYQLKTTAYMEYHGSMIEDRSATSYSAPTVRELCLLFDEYGDAAQPVEIDAHGCQGVKYKVEVLLPGSENLQDGAGLWLSQTGYMDFTLDWSNRESTNS